MPNASRVHSSLPAIAPLCVRAASRPVARRCKRRGAR
jgi:hypothetical protein